MKMRASTGGTGGKSLLISSEGPITILTLNRPQKLNAMDYDMLEQLRLAVNAISKDKSCRTVIITGSENRAFCSGDDINRLNNMKDEKDALAFIDQLQPLFSSIEGLDKLVIAAISGYCLGGGCELAISCDIRIATPDSVFGLPEVKLGLLPTGGGTYRLPALVGAGKAKELILIGEQISAQEALRIGLINRIVAKGSLMKEAKAIAMKTTQNSFNAMKNGKVALNANARRNNEIEKRSFLSSFNHSDKKEGLSAFIEHRKPDFE